MQLLRGLQVCYVRYQPFTQFLPAKSKCKSNSSLRLYQTAAHRADVRTHTHTHTWVGRRELAREWRVETDWEMKEPKQPKPAPAYCIG